MRKNIKLIGVIAAAVLIVCLAMGIYFMVTVQSMKFEAPGFYQVNGIKYSIEAGDKAVNDADGMRIERKGEYEIVTSSLPFYYQDRDAICLMTTMAYYKPAQEHKFNLKKLNYFTEIEYIGGGLTLKSGRNSDNTNLGFLYDGKDTYVFLQPAKLTYGKKTITLAPLSYAVVNYNTWIQIYDKENDNYIYKELNNSDATVICGDKEKYKINLGTDTVIYGDKEYLLHTAVDMYQSYF